MRRLCTESSRSYPGRSVPRAVRVPMGVELRPSLKGLEMPSNPKGAVVAKGAGLRASAKALESPPDPTATRAARRAATLGVTGQKSAEAIVAVPPWIGRAVKGRT
jgi:hypothetical protein